MKNIFKFFVSNKYVKTIFLIDVLGTGAAVLTEWAVRKIIATIEEHNKDNKVVTKEYAEKLEKVEVVE